MPVEFDDLILYTIQEVAEKLNTHELTIRRKIRSGELISRKIGKTTYITKESMRNFFNTGETQNGEPKDKDE